MCNALELYAPFDVSRNPYHRGFALSDLQPPVPDPKLAPPPISIIIPLLNEEAQISEALGALGSALANHEAEVIAVDGGSVDCTLEIIRESGFVRVIEYGRANRGLQMNEGARVSRGDVLLFLHADVRLPREALSAINKIMSQERLPGGCFQVRFPAGSRFSLKATARGINLRTRLFRTATGDQAIFVRRRVFEEIGGYRPIPLMEDVALFKEIKRRGRVAILNGQVEISPRRWLKHGVWRTMLLMYALRFGYWIGIPPATLKRFFVDVR